MGKMVKKLLSAILAALLILGQGAVQLTASASDRPVLSLDKVEYLSTRTDEVLIPVRINALPTDSPYGKGIYSAGQLFATFPKDKLAFVDVESGTMKSTSDDEIKWEARDPKACNSDGIVRILFYDTTMGRTGSYGEGSFKAGTNDILVYLKFQVLSKNGGEVFPIKVVDARLSGGLLKAAAGGNPDIYMPSLVMGTNLDTSDGQVTIIEQGLYLSALSVKAKNGTNYDTYSAELDKADNSLYTATVKTDTDGYIRFSLLPEFSVNGDTLKITCNNPDVQISGYDRIIPPGTKNAEFSIRVLNKDGSDAPTTPFTLKVICSGQLSAKVELLDGVNASADQDSLINALDVSGLINAGKTVQFVLTVKNGNNSSNDADKVKAAAGTQTLGATYDISLEQIVNSTDKISISQTTNPVKLKIEIPERIRDGKDYHIVRVHNGTATVLDTQVSGNYLVVESNQFSTYAIIYTPNSNNNSGGGTTSPTNDTNKDENVPVLIDGKEYDIGKKEVTDNTTTVTVDHKNLETQIDSATDTVLVPVSTNTTNSAVKLVVNDVEKMSEKEMTLVIKLDSVSYNLPAAAVKTNDIAEAFPNISTKDITFTVKISGASDTLNKEVEKATVNSGGELVVPALSFTVTAEYGGKTVPVDVFSQYAARVVSITEEQAKKITTAVVYENDGTLRHVPTCVYQEGGKWYAKVNSLTNSTYALIYNEASFTDAKGKWYEAIVTEMASRKIVNGVGNGIFEGDRGITRAEFASIVVRALGLPMNGTSNFSDVPATAWYAGAVGKAFEYKIVNGRDDGTFDPSAMITREEAMAMVARAAKIAELKGVSDTDISVFKDSDNVSSWAVSYVKYNIANGLIVGNENKEINPRSDISRAETATVILRLLQKAGLVDIRTKT